MYQIENRRNKISENRCYSRSGNIPLESQDHDRIKYDVYQITDDNSGHRSFGMSFRTEYITEDITHDEERNSERNYFQILLCIFYTFSLIPTPSLKKSTLSIFLVLGTCLYFLFSLFKELSVKKPARCPNGIAKVLLKFNSANFF